ncbi:hypothetical protein BB561_002376 [Smittium simulii]|uniref:Calponin-homology (CH) domain-containing protein n=1 Tax=Smittium simulii TaxID=133385 RepID=A0A2T9YQW6_9FUNG|nr:hypothetical protein BB561_002376 [Smittium simulii]
MEAEPSNHEASLIAWINTFPNLPNKISNLAELSDGVVLFEICENIDKSWFQLGRSTNIAAESWAFKYNNLKKLFRMLTAYCEEVLQYRFNLISSPDLNLIAKNEDVSEIIKICCIILTVAVNCEQKNEYIKRIMTLSENHQGALMISIESTMNQLEEFSHDHLNDNIPSHNNASAVSNNISASAISNDPNSTSIAKIAPDGLLKHLNADRNTDNSSFVSKLQVELLTQLDKNDELQNKLHSLSFEAERWHQKYDEEKAIKDEINEQADFVKLENQNIEMQSQLENNILKLSKANSELLAQKSLLSELDKLRDQEQEFLFLQEKVSKSENTIEKYRIKLEQSSDIKRKLNSAEQQLKKEIDAKNAIEEKYINLISSKSDPSNSSSNPIDNLAKLESRLNLATIENADLKNKLAEIENINKNLAEVANIAENNSRDLEERVRELELMGNTLSLKPSNASSLAAATNKLELAEALNESPAQLKKEIERLGLEIKKLRRGSVIKDDHIKEKNLLESWVETANKEKSDTLLLLAHEKAQIKLITATKDAQISQLEKNLEQKSIEIRNLEESNSNLTNQTKTLFSELGLTTREKEDYSSQIIKLNTELKEKTNSAKELELMKKTYYETKKESHSHELEKESLEGWYSDLDMKLNLELEKTKKLLIEKDEINKDLHKLRAENAKLVEGFESYKNENNDIKLMKARLLESREEFHNTELALQKSKEHIKYLSSELKKTINASNLSSYQAQSKENTQLLKQLDDYQEQINDLKKQNRDILKQKNFESKLLSSAWFYVQRKLEQNSGFGQSSVSNMEANYHPNAVSNRNNRGRVAEMGAAIDNNAAIQQSLKKPGVFAQRRNLDSFNSGSGVPASLNPTWLGTQRDELDSQIYPNK